eukprot:gene12386-26053_t
MQKKTRQIVGYNLRILKKQNLKVRHFEVHNNPTSQYKLQKGNSKSKRSIILWFVIIWSVFMTFGLYLMFQMTMKVNTRNEEKAPIQPQSVPNTKDNIAEDINIKPPENTNINGAVLLTIKNGEDEKSNSKETILKLKIKEPSQQKQAPKQSIQFKQTKHMKSANEVKSSIINPKSGIQSKEKSQQSIKIKPKSKSSPKSTPKLLKNIDIWKMPAKEQRRYLQDINKDLIPPSNKSALSFISYAKQSLLNINNPNNDINPPIWEHPGNGEGKQGDMLKYKIAGKEVEVPYGWPEESIFVLTASYRDPEVASTIARAFARAAHPERIFIGVHAQNEGGDLEPERDPIGGLIDQVRVSRAHYANSEGPTVARALAERLFRNETYVLGIDSHCHFIRGWDNVAIDMFRRIGNDHAIITTYPDSYGD